VDVLGRCWRHAPFACRVVIYGGALFVPIVLVSASAILNLPAFVFEHLVVLLVVAFAMAGRAPAIMVAVSAATSDNLFLQDPIGRPASRCGCR
jgi:hypothetical protein